MGRYGSAASASPESPPLLSSVTVRGPSMAPALRDGDRLLARRIRSAEQVRNGALVLVTWADYPGLLAVKRVVRRACGEYWVEGDNPYGTSDSRSYGPATVRSVVLARWWPPPFRILS